MKPLTAFKTIPGKKQQLLKLDDLFDLPNRNDKDYLDYLAQVSDNIDENGMKYPILVISKEHYWNRFPWHGGDDKLGVVTGSNRFRYAQNRGYTHIEGIICQNRSDWYPLWESTFYRVKSDLTNNQ